MHQTEIKASNGFLSSGVIAASFNP